MEGGKCEGEWVGGGGWWGGSGGVCGWRRAGGQSFLGRVYRWAAAKCLEGASDEPLLPSVDCAWSDEKLT